MKLRSKADRSPTIHPARDGIAAAIVTLLATCLCLTLLYTVGVRALKREVRNSLRRTATTISTFIDGDLHQTLVSPDQEQTDAYRRAVAPLRAVLARRPDIRFLYTMAARDDGVHIILDATPPGDADRDGVEDHSSLMQPYPATAPALLDALKTGIAQSDLEPIRDAWGYTLSGYAPILNSQHQQVGIVGIDMTLTSYDRRIAPMRRALLVGLGMAIVVSLLIGAGTGWLRHQTLRSVRLRDAAVEALRQSEMSLRTLIENTPDVLVRLNEAGQHLFASPALAAHFAMQPDAVIGKTHRELGFEPEACAFWEDRIRSVFSSGSAVEAEWRVRTRDGWETFNVRLFPERNTGGRVASVFGIVRDITQHRATEQHYQMLFEQMVNGFAVHEIICDSQGQPVDYRFLAVNPAFERMTGLRAADVVGRTVRSVLPQVEPHWIDTYGRVALTGEVIHFNNFSRELGRYYEVAAYRPLPRQFACIITDITERKKMEEERQKVQEQLQHVQKLEGLGLLAGGIAHDFNNLLMAILGNIDLALEEVPAESSASPSLHHIKQIALRAADLCNQMLAYSGRGKFVVRPLDLSGLVRDMVHLLEVSVSKKAVLRCHLAQNLPAVVADASQVRQVLMNLVINASEAIGDRSGVISVSTGFMECDEDYLRTAYVSGTTRPGPCVILEVTDTGCGMDKKTMARMFDPFFTTKFTGRGLGLAAVLGIVRGHHGAIKVYSEPGKGTSFKMLFPAAGESPAPDLQVQPPAVWQGSGTMLLVDDEEAVRSVAKRMLERIGFQVLTAGNGQEALALFKQRLPELKGVIMDLTMPHMDGDVAFQEMRRMHASIPIILSSGYNQQEVAERLIGKGLSGFLQKPYQLSRMVELLRTVFGAQPS